MSTRKPPHLTVTDAEEEERIQSQKSTFKPSPDISASIGARVRAGLDLSTGKVIYDLLARPGENGEPKMDVLKLFREYPGIRWEEPMTKAQAEWRRDILAKRAFIEKTIQDREQGALATTVGVAAGFAATMAGSPEFYVAPMLGGLTTAAAARVASTALSSKNGFKVAGAVKRAAAATKASRIGPGLEVTSGGGVTRTITPTLNVVSPAPAFKHNNVTMGLARLADVQNKHRFAMGFAEDAILTAAFTENLYQTREELLQQPYSAMDYWSNVMLAGVFSGLLNAGAGRMIDNAMMAEEVSFRAEQLIALATADGTPISSPQARKIAKAEWKMSRTTASWTGNHPDYEGTFTLGHRPKSKVTSFYDEDKGSIIINTAKVQPKNLEKALDKAYAEFKASASSKEPLSKTPSDKTPSDKTPSDKTPPAKTPPDSEDFQVELGPKGIKVPEEASDLSVEVTGDPGTKVNLVEVETSRLEDEMRLPGGGSDKGTAPETTSDNVLGAYNKALEDTPEGGDPFGEGGVEGTEIYRKLQKANDSSRNLLNLNQAHALKIAKDVRESAKLTAFPTASDEDMFSSNLLKSLGYTPLSLRTVNPDVLTEALRVEVKRLMKNQSLVNYRQIQASARWRDFSIAGRAEIQGNLDGSLVAGGTYFKGQGDNTYRRMETYRSRYANLIHQTAVREGVEDFINKYDDAAALFWKDVDKALSGSTDISTQAKAMADVYRTVVEHQRVMLNRQGAGIRHLDGFFISTVHNRANIVADATAWKTFMLDSDNIDWHRMGFLEEQDKVRFIEDLYVEIDGGFHHDTELNDLVQGGRKGSAFAHKREIHFIPGKQSGYNDLFGRQNTSKELFDQIELRAKAIAITETMGPNTKATYKAMEAGIAKMNSKDAMQVQWHWDEMTGETNTVVSQPIAKIGQGFRNLVNAMVLHGTGITIAATDPLTQIVNLRTSGLSSSLGRAARHVYDSYGEAINSIIKGKDTLATERIKMSILTHDTNLQATRNLLGDSSIGSSGDIPERLSLTTIKLSGAGIFTKISQMSTIIGMQRRMAELVNASEFSIDFKNQLGRFNVSEVEFRSLKKYKLDDQISVYDIEDKILRQKMQNFLDEGMRLGSLQADPRQSSITKFGTKSGTLLGEGVRSWMQYMPAALAQHQKVLMRLAVMGGGDARFISLLHRSRFAEVLTVLSGMLGSAVMVMTLKDALRNKEPFWTGDKPFNEEHMWRILKISGILPLITEVEDSLISRKGEFGGGMPGQMGASMYNALDTAVEGDVWKTVRVLKQNSPFAQTNIGPAPVIIDALLGFMSEEYLRDTQRRIDQVELLSGQSPIIK